MTSRKKSLKKLQEQLRNLQKERARLLRIFYLDRPLIAGTYSEIFMRCGKATCRCHQEGGHFATRLSKWTRGKLKTRIVRVDDRERVEKASDHYKSHKSVLRDLKRLHIEELNILKQIIEVKTIEYQ